MGYMMLPISSIIENSLIAMKKAPIGTFLSDEVRTGGESEVAP
jgi:hypothetical protein